MNSEIKKIITKIADQQLIEVERLKQGMIGLKVEGILNAQRELGRIEGLALAVSCIAGDGHDIESV